MHREAGQTITTGFATALPPAGFPPGHLGSISS